jgi:hypothetical protein
MPTATTTVNLTLIGLRLLYQSSLRTGSQTKGNRHTQKRVQKKLKLVFHWANLLALSDYFLCRRRLSCQQ